MRACETSVIDVLPQLVPVIPDTYSIWLRSHGALVGFRSVPRGCLRVGLPSMNVVLRFHFRIDFSLVSIRTSVTKSLSRLPNGLSSRRGYPQGWAKVQLSSFFVCDLVTPPPSKGFPLLRRSKSKIVPGRENITPGGGVHLL